MLDSMDSMRVHLRNERTKAGWPNRGLETVLSRVVRMNLKLSDDGNASVQPSVETNGTTKIGGPNDL